jgi:transposase
MFTYFSPESRIPAEHPLRGIKRYADAVLRSMNAEFDRLYTSTGRPSIPPERLLPIELFAPARTPGGRGYGASVLRCGG